MKRFRSLTIAAAVVAAFALPAAVAQQRGPNDAAGRIQQRDATGNPAGSPTQPARSMSGGDNTMDRSSGASSQQYAGGTVRSVQQALHSKGYDVGTIDGVMGARTEAAVRQFQQQQGIMSSGRLDMPTLSALNVSAAGNNMSDRSGTMAPSVPNDRRGSTTGGMTPRSSGPGPTYPTSPIGPVGGATNPPSSSSPGGTAGGTARQPPASTAPTGPRGTMGGAIGGGVPGGGGGSAAGRSGG